MKPTRSRRSTLCPCGLAATYAECCGRWHAGQPAPDAEKLMRSRYVAYVMKLEHYVLSTWHESKRPATLNTHSSSEPAVAPRFFRLEVKAHTVSKPGTASVEFIALYKSGGRAVRMHEVSHFVFEHGQWWYVDGEVSDH